MDCRQALILFSARPYYPKPANARFKTPRFRYVLRPAAGALGRLKSATLSRPSSRRIATAGIRPILPLGRGKSGGRYEFVTGHRPETQAEWPLSISANSHSRPEAVIDRSGKRPLDDHLVHAEHDHVKTLDAEPTHWMSVTAPVAGNPGFD